MAAFPKILSNFTANDIQFSNDCDLTAKFAVGTTNYDAPLFDKVQDPATFPYAELITLLITIHPVPFASVTRGAILDWVDAANITLLASLAFNTTRWETGDRWGNCTIAYCRNLKFEGNADIAGIGVFISYIFEVVLASLFLFSFAPAYLLRWHPFDKPLISTLRISSSTWAALHTALATFWDTAFLFTFSVGIAGIVISRLSLSWYDRHFLAPSLSLSGCVIFATWPVYIPNCRHTFPRWCGLFFILAMLGFLCATKDLYDTKSGSGMTAFDLYCMNIYEDGGYLAEGVVMLQYFTVYGFLVPAAAVVVGYFLLMFVAWRWGREAWPVAVSERLVRKRLGVWVAVWCMYLTVLTYGGLVYLALMRYLMFEVAGGSLRENKWGFGQVLSLATWVPAVVDFVVIWRGHLKALKYRLPVGVDVKFDENMAGNESEVSDRERSSIVGGGGAPEVRWSG